MEKLYIKQKVFSWGDSFTVKNEYGEDLYRVKGEVLSLGKKLHIYDSADRELALIRQKVMTFLPRYFIDIDGQQAAEVVREMSFFKPRYSIHGPDWQVEGDFWGHDYRLAAGEKTVAGLKKAWMSWGDSYELEVARREDALLALAVVLVIDCVNAASAAAASSAST